MKKLELLNLIACSNEKRLIRFQVRLQQPTKTQITWKRRWAKFKLMVLAMFATHQEFEDYYEATYSIRWDHQVEQLEKGYQNNATPNQNL